jgi:hypothetical protein
MDVSLGPIGQEQSLNTDALLNVDMAPTEPLTQVCFVHNYVQLVFQDDCFSLFNDIEIRSESSSFIKGQPGFRDELVQLIGQYVTKATGDGGYCLAIVFENGAVLRTLQLTEDQRWPESWQFNRPPNVIVVGQN